jgi:hypothetical protein
MTGLRRQSTAPRIELGGRDSVPRAVLAGTENGWLYMHEKDEARELAETGTDEECAAFLDELERRCGSRLEMWRWSR